MSLLCCFFFRDYGSKRKSGKSPMVLFFFFCGTCNFFHLVALDRHTQTPDTNEILLLHDI